MLSGFVQVLTWKKYKDDKHHKERIKWLLIINEGIINYHLVVNKGRTKELLMINKEIIK